MTSKWFLRASCVVVFLLTFSSLPVHAQDSATDPFQALEWVSGPATASLGSIAQVEVPEGFQFVGRPGAGKFMELNQNPSDGSELGILMHSTDRWFVVFEFSDRGYVKDDDRDLDADAIIASIREGTEAANKLRAERGWPSVNVAGWHQAPFYDAQTNNLTWAIRGESDSSASINHSTRLLGRRGVMNVDLVASPDEMDSALGEFNAMLDGFSYTPGNRYSEFTRGDKIAEYGLAGLIVGGTGVALAKAGILQKFWKLIVVGFIALAGAIKQLVATLFRRKQEA